jgi:hypothetical protein
VGVAERRRRTGGSGNAAGGGARWWWLTIPALGLAAYAAFDATLGLVSDDPAGPPPTAVLDAGTASRPAGFGSSSGEPVLTPPMDGAPASDAVPVGAAPGAAVDAATVVPEPTPTAASLRAAANERPVKRKPAPKENITESDRRALEDVLERATRQGDR